MNTPKEYIIQILDRKFRYGHEPSYLKAKAVVDKYPIAFQHAIKMERIYSSRVRELNKRSREFGLNNAEIALREKDEKSSDTWEKMIDDAIRGRPSQFFIKMNNLKPVEE